MNLYHRALRRYFSWANRRFAVKPMHCSGSQAVISFSFDDFPRSAYLEGAPILEQHGARGTFFTSLGQADNATNLNVNFTYDDLSDLVSRGHEIGCHTYGHELSQLVSARAYSQSLKRNRDEIKGILKGYSWQSFAYPQGNATPSTKRLIAKHFYCGRGIHAGINQGTFDGNLLLANSIYSHRSPVQNCLNLIRKVAQDGGWLIFYTHDVSPQPSRYGCTTEEFASIARAAANSGAGVMTLSQALNAICEV